MIATRRLIQVTFCLVIASLVSSCATGVWMKPAKTKGIVDASWVTGVGLDSKMKAKKIEDKLVRRDGMGYGTYMAEVTPYTDAWIEVSEKERGKHEMKSEKEIAKSIAESKELLTKNKTCFKVFVSSNTTIDSARPSNWIVKAKSSSDEIQNYDYMKAGIFSDIPESMVSASGGIVTTTWYNTGIYCGPKVALEKGLEVTVIPKLVPDHMKGERVVVKWTAGSAKDKRKPASSY